MNFKFLIEKRNELVAEMDKVFAAAEAEKRALTDDESVAFEERKAEIEKIDATLKMKEEARSFERTEAEPVAVAVEAPADKFALESRAFGNYLRGLESRGGEMAFGANGAVVPTTIMNKIIETVENICPIYALSTKYNMAGTISFPVYDEGTDSVKVAYAQEFTALASHSGKFTSVNLGGFLTGALVKISRSLINNAQFDIVSYVITKVAEAIARFLEHELLLGSGSSAMTGVLTACTNKVAATAKALTVDNLIDTQLAVAQQYQAGCVWLMNTKTLGVIRKLKDGNQRYLLNDDINAPFGFTLLGKPVYLSDNMADIGASAKSVVYGDLSGMYVNIRPNSELQILNEKYADEHAVGVVCWGEYDAKLVEPQKIAVVAHAAS